MSWKKAGQIWPFKRTQSSSVTLFCCDDYDTKLCLWIRNFILWTMHYTFIHIYDSFISTACVHLKDMKTIRRKAEEKDTRRKLRWYLTDMLYFATKQLCSILDTVFGTQTHPCSLLISKLIFTNYKVYIFYFLGSWLALQYKQIIFLSLLRICSESAFQNTMNKLFRTIQNYSSWSADVQFDSLIKELNHMVKNNLIPNQKFDKTVPRIQNEWAN